MYTLRTYSCIERVYKALFSLILTGGGGGANTKVPDMYGGGGGFSGPKTQK